MQKDSGGRRWRPRQLFFLLFLLVSATAICLISAWHSAELVLASLKKGETGRLKLSSSRPVSSPAEGWKVWLSQKETVDIAFRENHYFLATARGGIIVYDQNLKPVQQITSLEGLLENAVTALTVSGDTLWIALKHYGLVALCEGKILSYTSPAETEYPVSCLTDSPEGLLVGTMGDGVLKLSGSSFVRVAGLSGLRVRCLAYDQHRILVGTDDRGVIQLQGRVPVTISVREGLSSLTVFDVLACGDYFLVATAEGVFRVSHDRQARCVLEGFSTALGQISGTVWAGTLMAGLRPVGVSSFPEQLTGQRINRIKTVGGRTFVLTDDGAYVWLDRHWERLPDLSSIPSGFITSVAEGSRGLYAGTFEEGLLLLEDGRLRKQVTNEELREVNCLFLDEDSDQLLVGTGSGLIFLNLDGKWQGQLTEEILGGSVSGLCRYGRYIACALSGGGVCLLEGKELFNLSRFQGLVNNHAYSCCVFDSLLYIGTLGGVSVLSGKKVVASFSAPSSPLPANWVTALYSCSGALYAGTYGGGLACFSDGKWESLRQKTGSCEVNNNALAGYGDYLLAGTVRHGLLILDTKSHKCSYIREGLPSRNVTAVLVRGQRLYLGTECGLACIEKDAFQPLLP